jgi:hypothetical protein
MVTEYMVFKSIKSSPTMFYITVLNTTELFHRVTVPVPPTLTIRCLLIGGEGRL